ncbi:MAG: nucleoside 2-deoxyribosyltransferase [Kiritimatiellaeota bacterium]|nr:nucleoside 2-deoxyribosyltransferase [Kiritimatiellota bacterium]
MKNELGKQKIYLCGPIMDEYEGHARAWRETAKKLLGKNFILLDPMRRNFKDREVDSANEIVEFDLQDVRDADIILVNYNKNSIGTAMEVFYASHDLNNGLLPVTAADAPTSASTSSPRTTPAAERVSVHATTRRGGAVAKRRRGCHRNRPQGG